MRDFTSEFRKLCKKIDKEINPMIELNDIEEVLGTHKLYNIVKRSTDSKVNKVVAIGFTFEQAQEWVVRKAFRAKEVGQAVYFYDIVDQENKEAMDPLWNPRPFFVGEVA